MAIDFTNEILGLRQRLDKYSKALSQLKEGVQLFAQRPLSKMEQQGLIKAFEFTYDLTWNGMKDFLEYQGITNIIGSRDAFREAFQKNLITNGDVWKEMIKSRNQTSQLKKSDLTFSTKYEGKNPCVCFCHDENWYLVPHDQFSAEVSTIHNFKKHLHGKKEPTRFQALIKK